MANKRKCRHCGEFIKDFIVYGLMAFCNYDHAASYAYANKSKGAAIKQKIARKVKKEKLDKLKTNTDWARETERSFNRYIGVRDRELDCGMCGKPINSNRHSCHYRSVGACKALRFNTFNVVSGCHRCNVEQGGNLIEYRIRLVRRFGSDKVEWLESQNAPTRYSVEYLIRLKKIFNRRAKHLIKLRGY